MKGKGGEKPSLAASPGVPGHPHTGLLPHSFSQALIPPQAPALRSRGRKRAAIARASPTSRRPPRLLPDPGRPRGSPPARPRPPSRLLDVGVRGAAAQLQHGVIVLPHGGPLPPPPPLLVAMVTAAEGHFRSLPRGAPWEV